VSYGQLIGDALIAALAVGVIVGIALVGIGYGVYVLFQHVTIGWS
jgi:hypothetical protein